MGALVGIPGCYGSYSGAFNHQSPGGATTAGRAKENHFRQRTILERDLEETSRMIRQDEGELALEPRKQGPARSRLRDLLLLLPRFAQLLHRLLWDPRVPIAEKTLLLGTLTYVLTPLDFLPDFLPFIGQVDDLYLVGLVLLRLLHQSGEDLLREHWEGPGDLSLVVHRIVTASRYVLPKRLRRLLLGQVDTLTKPPDKQ